MDISSRAASVNERAEGTRRELKFDVSDDVQLSDMQRKRLGAILNGMLPVLFIAGQSVKAESFAFPVVGGTMHVILFHDRDPQISLDAMQQDNGEESGVLELAAKAITLVRAAVEEELKGAKRKIDFLITQGETTIYRISLGNSLVVAKLAGWKTHNIHGYTREIPGEI